MSSSLIVEICEIKEIKEHPNADRLEIAVVKGWNCLVGKGEYKVGDAVVYVPVDSVLPTDLGDRLGIRNYLGGNRQNRVRCAKLRGEMSYGLIIDNEENWEVGTDVAEHYGIVKYEPPVRGQAGDAAPEDPLFPKYTDIENIRNFPDVFEKGEKVVITEKVDGTNCRISYSIFEDIPEWKAGSHKVKRKRPPDEEIETNTYWYPYTLESVRNMLTAMVAGDLPVKPKCVVLYGEVYGAVRGGHKSMHYGKPGSLNFVAFSIKWDGKYLDWAMFESWCRHYNVPMVPMIEVCDFDMEKIEELSAGPSLLAAQNGTQHMREGIVICSYGERSEWKCDRAILKMLNPDYLLMKNKKAAKGEVVDFKDE